MPYTSHKTESEDLTRLEVILVSENEEKYSAYMELHSNISQVMALFSGFTFSAITILLNQFPDPTQVTAQMTLFILAVMLDLFLFKLLLERETIANCVRIAPPLPKTWSRWARTWTWIEYAGWILLGAVVVFMYFLWYLLYLAFASSVVYALFMFHAFHSVRKPILDFTPWVRK